MKSQFYILETFITSLLSLAVSAGSVCTGFCEQFELALLGFATGLFKSTGFLGDSTAALGDNATALVLLEVFFGQTTRGVFGVSVIDLGTTSDSRNLGHYALYIIHYNKNQGKGS
jgi:hypothetical protein